MPEPRPERNPGESLQDYVARLEAWSAAQNAPAPKPGTAEANANKPAGTEVSPGRIISPNGLTTYMYNATSGWTPSPYPPSAADKAAAGVKAGTAGTGGTSNTNYAVQNAQNKSAQQVAQGGLQTLPANFHTYPGGVRAVDTQTGMIYTKNPDTGVWTTFGNRASREDMAAYVRDLQTAKAAGGTTPGVGTAPATPGISTTLNPVQGNQAPLLSSFSQFTTPGREISADGRMTMRTGNEMNTLVRSPNGPNISVVPPGVRPIGGGHINNYAFGGNERGGPTSPGVSPAYAQFPSTSFMVPSTYQAGPSGFSSDAGGGSFQAFGIPFGVTGPSLTSQGSAGMLQLNGPQNLNLAPVTQNGVSTGQGFLVNSPMAYNNIGLTYGRELGGPNRDAATGAVESAMLYNAQQKYGPEGAMALLTRVDPGAFTGQPGLYGNLPLEGNGVRTDSGFIFGGSDMGDYSPMERFAGGGRVVSGPLGPGTSGPKTMVTNGPKYLIDAKTGKIEALMGEDNADPGFAPNRERLTFSGPNNSTLNIKPLEPFAGGGQIQTQGPPPMPSIMPEAAIRWILDQKGFSQRPDLVGAPPQGRVMGWYPGFADGGTITSAPATYKNKETGQTLEVPASQVPQYNTFPQWEAVNPPAPTPSPTPEGNMTPTAPTPTTPPAPVPGSQPLPQQNLNFGLLTDPTILQPWQAEQQRNAMRQAQRDTYAYRFRNAGLNGPVALDVQSGNAPQGELPANMYYSTDNQVNRVLNEILGAQQEYRTLGPAEDMKPIIERATYVGNALDDLQRIRQLEDNLIAAGASGNVPSASPEQIAQWQAQIGDLSSQVGQMLSQPKETWTESTYQEYANLNKQIALLQGKIEAANNAGTGAEDKKAAIQQEIDAIKARLPANANQADLTTELAQLNDRKARQNKREGLATQVQNLKNLQVPALNGPIIPVGAAA